MPDINISVENKIAESDGSSYICGNSDFVVNFAFDSEWDAYGTKTARFSYNGSYVDVVFDGNQCAIPIISDTYFFLVGVYAGNLHTTTPARVPCKKSILCDTGSPADPTPDVYNQIMDKLNNLDGVNPATKDKLGVIKIGDNLHIAEDGTLSAEAVPDWAKAESKPTYTAEEVGAVGNDELSDAINTALEQAKASGQFDGKDGADGYTPVKGVDYFDGTNGSDGKDGVTPTIGSDGNWYIGSTDTGKPSRGEKGDTGATGAKGEKGDTGAQGAKGDKGDTGAAGKDGAQGAKGDKGDAGTPGAKGEDGKSAYQIWLDAGNTGSEAAFLASLKGDAGTKGDTGAAGAPGADGHSPVVTAVKSGKTTTISVDGTAIATVNDGADGANGKDGTNGKDGAKGDKGDKGDTGADGHSPAVTATKSGTVTTIKVDGTAVATINDGAKGDTGEKGATGAQGEKGDTGATGAKGADGYTPVKGTDYWTEADKTEMVNATLAALPTWTGGSY